MSALEGTITTPFGAVQKKTALIVGGGLAGVLAIVWYRSKKASAAAATASAGEAVGIDPATGYVYGSAEDAAALANQAAYVDPTAVGYGGGGGSSSYSGSTTGSFVSNGQWSQAAVQYMTGQGLVEDPTALAAALGKYLAGTPVTDAQKSLIEQAIAFQGFPPVAGVAGYPPSINTAPVQTDTPPPDTTPGKPGVVTGFRDEGPQWTDSLVYRWDPVPGAVSYELADGDGSLGTVTGTGWTRRGLLHNGNYYTKIRARNAAGIVGEWSPTLYSKTKN